MELCKFREKVLAKNTERIELSHEQRNEEQKISNY
jgi:hypothetical protein